VCGQSEENDKGMGRMWRMTKGWEGGRRGGGVFRMIGIWGRGRGRR